MCHVSELTNPSLPLPPLQEVSPCLQRATFPSSPTHLSHTFSPPASESLFCTMPRFRAHQPTPPSSSPPVSESSLTCHVSIQLMDKPQTEVINWWRKCDYGCQDTVNSMIGLFLIDIKYTVFSFITAYLQRLSEVYQKL